MSLDPTPAQGVGMAHDPGLRAIPHEQDTSHHEPGDPPHGHLPCVSRASDRLDRCRLTGVNERQGDGGRAAGGIVAPVRVVFLGEKPLGLRCLQLLASMDEVEVVGVCTRREMPVWWGDQVLRAWCTEAGLPLVDRADIPALEADLLISVLYPLIIEAEVLTSARMGTFNLHEAPLPRWRGCNGYSHALMAGDAAYETTLHEMVPELDAGRHLAIETLPIGATETAKELYERTAEASYRLAERTFPALVRGELEPWTREGEPASIMNARSSLLDHKRLPDETPLLDAWTAARALDFVPWEPAFVVLGGRPYYLVLERSLGREDPPVEATEPLAAPDQVGDLVAPAGGVGRIADLPRPLYVMEAGQLRASSPLFGRVLVDELDLTA